MNRRIFAFGGLAAAVTARAAVTFSDEMTVGDTSIRLFPTDDGRKDSVSFMIGVRTSVNADGYLAEVFYRVPYKESTTGYLLLHKESVGIVAGNNVYGATNGDFDIPHDLIDHVRIRFFKNVGEELEFQLDGTLFHERWPRLLISARRHRNEISHCEEAGKRFRVPTFELTEIPE